MFETIKSIIVWTIFIVGPIYVAFFTEPTKSNKTYTAEQIEWIKDDMACQPYRER